MNKNPAPSSCTYFILTPKDRLSVYFYWDDQQSFVQAVNIAKEQVFDLENIRQWAEEEQELEKFTVFERSYKYLQK
ncbi:hypothetical protein QUF61_17180 [Candidatus Venteria ishoeyi]|uniref:hypothetical protein n=1 Tax=Candidatus Venteria ishoeyi TaxID=1899563 RepID=UPI0025A5CBD9|nr:hypothetical protein [Candidatus Venteria ishoeyi]MDM8548226.1 hypothetical protein [Candidatus Venteria ishoeyi]